MNFACPNSIKVFTQHVKIQFDTLFIYKSQVQLSSKMIYTKYNHMTYIP